MLMLPQSVDTSALFVNRREQIELIVDKLHDISSGRLASGYVITLTGIPGIGKTVVLHEASRQAQALGIPAIFIDYKFEATQSPLQTLEKIAAAFFQDAPDWVASWNAYQKQPYSDAAWKNLLSKFLQTFAAQLTKSPLLLLLDNADKVWDIDDHPGIRSTLEAIIEQGGKQHRLLAITAARLHLDWDNAELRRQVVPQLLPSFEREDTKALLAPATADYQVLADQIYTVTHGYPKASVLAFQWAIEHLKASPRKDLNSLFAAREEDLIFTLFDEIIRRYILVSVQSGERRQRLRALLRYLGPLRRFDDILLADLLPQIAPKIFPEITTAKARVYIFDLAHETHLVRWDSARQAFVLDASMRRFLALELKYRERERLMLIHKLACQWYDRELTEVVQSTPSTPQSVLYFIEYVFHLTSYRTLANQRSNLVTDIRAKMVTLFDGYKYRERNHFKQEFIRDNELAELLGQQAYRQLRQFVNKHINLD
jgi:hypothetical protein